MAALAALGATAVAGETEREANLDTDAAREHVKVVDERPDLPSGPFHYRLRIQDTCPDGTSIDVAVSELGGDITPLEIRRADTRRGKEVLFAVESAGRGPALEARLVAWRKASSPCRKPRALFDYDDEDGQRSRPRGARALNDYFVSVGDYAPKRPGRELRLDEWFQDRDDPISEPTMLRRSQYRYDKRRDRYVRYSRVLKRNQEY